MSEEFQFRVMAPMCDVWDAMPVVLTGLFPDEQIGELPSLNRHSVSVTGRRGYILVTRLHTESSATTILSVVINVRAYSQLPAMAKFRRAEANRVYNAISSALSGRQA